MCYAQSEKILKYDKEIQNEWHIFNRKRIFELYYGKRTRKKPNVGDFFFDRNLREYFCIWSST